MPVTLAPGRARLAMIPSATGSYPITMTTGVACVAASATRADCKVTATIASTPTALISRASAGKRAASPPE